MTTTNAPSPCPPADSRLSGQREPIRRRKLTDTLETRRQPGVCRAPAVHLPTDTLASIPALCPWTTTKQPHTCSSQGICCLRAGVCEGIHLHFRFARRRQPRPVRVENLVPSLPACRQLESHSVPVPKNLPQQPGKLVREVCAFYSAPSQHVTPICTSQPGPGGAAIVGASLAFFFAAPEPCFLLRAPRPGPRQQARGAGKGIPHPNKV